VDSYHHIAAAQPLPRLKMGGSAVEDGYNQISGSNKTNHKELP